MTLRMFIVLVVAAIVILTLAVVGQFVPAGGGMKMVQNVRHRLALALTDEQPPKVIEKPPVPAAASPPDLAPATAPAPPAASSALAKLCDCPKTAVAPPPEKKVEVKKKAAPKKLAQQRKPPVVARAPAQIAKVDPAVVAPAPSALAQARQPAIVDVEPPPIYLPLPARPAPVVTTTAINPCADRYTLALDAWNIGTFPDGLRRVAEELIAAAEARDSRHATNADAYKPDDFSRTLGPRLFTEVRTRASVNADVQVNLRNPKTLKVEQDLGIVHLVNGTGSICLSEEQHTKIVEAIFPSNFRSVAVSGGARRLWLFSYEWKGWRKMHLNAGLWQ